MNTAARPKLSFYTNMPTPYQLDFFESLSERFQLTVVYYSVRENDREWDMPLTSALYKTIILNNHKIARFIQRWVVSFHFDPHIFKVLRHDDSPFVIVNGTYWSPNTILSLIISYRRKRKVLYFSEAVFKASNHLAHMLKWLLLSIVRNCTHGLLAIGSTAVASFKHYGYKRPLYNVPYSIQTSRFYKSELEADKLVKYRETYNPHGNFVFITSGALIERKGMDLVIRAFLMSPANANAKLLILGDGPERRSLERLADGAPNIQFVGFVRSEEIRYFFGISNAFVFASRYDGWGLVINEAIAAGLPIICSNKVGAAVDRLTHRKDALLFTPVDDVRELESYISLLITMPLYGREMASNLTAIRDSVSSAYNARKIYEICELP